jgi:cell division protein FtsA
MRKIYASVDIGSYTFKFLVGEAQGDRINVLAATSVKAKGIRKGLVVDSNLAVNTIRDGIKTINDSLGFEIKKVIVNVPDYNVKFMYVTGRITVNGIVETNDINKVIKDSVYNKLDEDYELVTVVPLDFICDGEEGNVTPLGKECKILEIKGIMISVPKKNIYSVIGILSGAGLEVIDITISGLADYYQVRNKKLDKKVGAIINLGHETTNVSIINNGKIMNTETIQLGGINIENDIAYVFGTNIIDARKIKEKFALCNKRFINLNEKYELINNIDEKVKLNQLEVTEVVQSRLAEILKLARKQITLLTKRDIDYIVITGGLTEIKSFKNLVYEILGKDVIIYLMDVVGIRDNKYTTAMGMIKAFHDKMQIRGKEYSMVSPEDEELLLTPDDNKKNEKTVVSKIFKGFIRNKEEKYE